MWRRATAASATEDAAAPAFTGAVLCGGASTRMGQDKALLPIDGVPMAVRVAEALRQAGAREVVAVGGQAAALAAAGLDVRSDDHPGDGPLPATITALRMASEPHVLVASCDLVAPSAAAMAATIAALLAHPGAVGAVPVDGSGERQWTHAAWRRDAVRALEPAYEQGMRSLKRVGAGLLIYEVHGLPDAALADADRPGDLPVPGSLRAMTEVPEIDVDALAKLYEAGVPIIDVRTDNEFAAARVPGVRHIPLAEVAERADEVPTDVTVYVICGTGPRSAKAVQHYRSLGIDAVNVAGGTRGWIDAGFPTESGSGSST